ncbi:MAG TPA: LytR C-terminal domain-containing protein [Mycobacteriales bacterium]|nr:LytR C-terminal domain-containing protein [Mycobacteriales bacterium]
MSESGGPQEPTRPAVGRHRAPVPPTRRILYRFVAPLTAVAVVVAVVVVLIVVRGQSSGSGPGPGVIVAPTTTPVISPTATPTSALSPTPTVDLTHPAPTHRPTPQVTHHRPPAWRTATAAVRVYNSTRITGLAHHVAAEVAAKGWTVPIVGNVTGASAVTTLYYAPGKHAAARHLAHEFAGIRRLRPNRDEHLDYHGLTLVLTADWHD